MTPLLKFNFLLIRRVPSLVYFAKQPELPTVRASDPLVKGDGKEPACPLLLLSPLSDKALQNHARYFCQTPSSMFSTSL